MLTVHLENSPEASKIHNTWNLNVFHSKTVQKVIGKSQIKFPHRENCKVNESVNNVKPIFLQSCTANGVSCKWHQNYSIPRKWIGKGRLLWSLTKGATSHASLPRSSIVKQGELGLRKGESKTSFVLILISKSTFRIISVWNFLFFRHSNVAGKWKFYDGKFLRKFIQITS